MVGIKGLKKGDRPKVERQAEKFIAGAASKKTTPRRGQGPRFQRYTFSLTADVSAEIDKLSLVPREFRTSRSDVVKAGVEALKRLPKSDLVALLRQISS